MRGAPAHNLSASPWQIIMISRRRRGSIGRKISGGTAGAAVATAGGGAAAGGAASFAAGAIAGFAGAIAGFAGGWPAGGGAVAVDAAGAAAGAGAMALTALLHPPDSLATLRLRHSKASAPPGVTPEQFAMKSDRQFERMALVCSGVGCCACAETRPSAIASPATSVIRPIVSAVNVIVPPKSCPEITAQIAMARPP